jgi:hypothetical protein
MMEVKRSRGSAPRYSIFGNSLRNTHFKKESNSQQDEEDIPEEK